MPLKKMFTSTSPRNSSSLDSDHDAYYSKQNPDNFPVKEQEIYNIDLEENNVSSRSSTSTSPSARDDSFAVPDGKDENTRLRKDLKARHISMIAIGGSLGTGLLIGTGTALLTGGPVAMLIAYAFVGLLVFYTMACLGEMASYIPLDGFTSYASRYVDPALGFAIGYTYLFKYFILPPNQLTAAALVIQYWISRDRVNPGVWITIFLVVIVAINVVGVKFFGEFEFWLSSFKVMVMLGLILLLFIIMLGGGPNHDRLGFRYWRDPGAFKEYSTAITGGKGKFVSFVAVFVYSLFSYTGIELTGIVCSEAENPRKSVPKAIKLTVYRIIVFTYAPFSFWVCALHTMTLVYFPQKVRVCLLLHLHSWLPFKTQVLKSYLISSMLVSWSSFSVLVTQICTFLPEIYMRWQLMVKRQRSSLRQVDGVFLTML